MLLFLLLIIPAECFWTEHNVTLDSPIVEGDIIIIEIETDFIKENLEDYLEMSVYLANGPMFVSTKSGLDYLRPFRFHLTKVLDNRDGLPLITAETVYDSSPRTIGTVRIFELQRIQLILRAHRDLEAFDVILGKELIRHHLPIFRQNDLHEKGPLQYVIARNVKTLYAKKKNVMKQGSQFRTPVHYIFERYNAKFGPNLNEHDRWITFGMIFDGAPEKPMRRFKMMVFAEENRERMAEIVIPHFAHEVKLEFKLNGGTKWNSTSMVNPFKPGDYAEICLHFNEHTMQVYIRHTKARLELSHDLGYLKGSLYKIEIEGESELIKHENGRPFWVPNDLTYGKKSMEDDVTDDEPVEISVVVEENGPNTKQAPPTH